ncbi:glycosyltransferase family 2 protein [Lutibacter maritimus]|uniref:Glycosyl transferase family 2 n=1 Tax=Lutibacter maritimus TaxID=593133 RepID=A0A1I6P5J0_9FLAO|nr:glycosyltransferase [Lutibacter maritimus]SFS35401.1 Glycosyl transferase family 2 [Lutibacter maritimus]
MNEIKTHITKTGESLLYFGNPDLSQLDELALGPGDLWHSSLDQGFTNAFEDIIYQTAVYWWFLNDFEGCNQVVSWRVNPSSFVIRKKIWEQLGGFDSMFLSMEMKGIDVGCNLLRNQFGLPLYIKGLFQPEENNIEIPSNDRYLFYRKHFKIHHSIYMIYRKGLFNFFSEIKAYKYAKNHFVKKEVLPVTPRKLNPIEGTPTVSLVIPTMRRQKYTQLLLEDHKKQTYPISQVVIVDATPEEERDASFYKQADFNFKLDVHWQTTKGSCRARNEALEKCTGDYIIFADDDIRIQPDFVENHIRLLQTYNADACNGLDIMAENVNQNLEDLENRLNKLGEKRWHVGVAKAFSNANSCVKRAWIDRIGFNDINFDGGYGEDSDFGMRLLKNGAVVLHNPFSANLHLKPPTGGYRWWGSQANILGKKRKQQPWELNNPVKYIKPVPSPTITYGILKHYKPHQIKEWRTKHFFIYLLKAPLKVQLIRFLKYPYKQLQFSKSLQYAKGLLHIGERFK